MTAAPVAPSSLIDLVVGDQVTLKRNLDHPAWMKQIPADPRDGGGTKFARDPKVVEELGVCAVVDVREIPAVPSAGSNSWPGREAKTLVRLPNSFWYDAATGLQDGSSATRIERVAG